jgi:hypothetical protein
MPTGRIQVAPGQTIVSAGWGNPLWDHSVQCFASAADRANQFPAPQPGAVSFTEDTRTLWVYVNGAWVPVPTTASAAGSLVISVSNSASGTATVTFPAGRFTSPPSVVVVSNRSDYFGFMGTPTAASTTLGVAHRDGTVGTNSITAFWHAMAVG